MTGQPDITPKMGSVWVGDIPFGTHKKGTKPDLETCIGMLATVNHLP